MNAGKRDGTERKKRNCGVRQKELGNYYVVVDAEKTEPIYFSGLRDSFPKPLRSNIEIVVETTPSSKTLLEKCREGRREAAFRRCWIVFDRDEVQDFDAIVSQAQKEKIGVGWSNPCFELWLSAYFGKMNNFDDSKECVASFSRMFKAKTGKEYDKNNRNLYAILTKYGDETKALERAKVKEQNALDVASKPSEARCSTVYQLVQEFIDARRR